MHLRFSEHKLDFWFREEPEISEKSTNNPNLSGTLSHNIERERDNFLGYAPHA